MRSKQSPEQLTLPWGARFVEALMEHPLEDVRAMASSKEAQVILDSVRQVMENPVEGAFLHSALCAMSLPVRRPKDEFAPIVRQDGNYTLIIRPIERMQMIDGEWKPVKLGVPFGVHARLVILYIMSEAVKRQSKEIYLGNSFSAWLRRMGITNTSSGGVRGTRSLVQEQIDRLLACEWTIRWDERLPETPDRRGKPRNKGKNSKKFAEDSMISAFAVNDVRMVDQYAGISSRNGEFISRFVLSDRFYDSLVRHAVPLNERAFAALKRSATQIDLYTYLAYRLPRIPEGEVVHLSWQDLRTHLGNHTKDEHIYKFRQTVRRCWAEVSGVYPQARRAVDFDDLVIKLRYAEAPVDGHIMRLPTGKLKRMSMPRLSSVNHGRRSKQEELQLTPDTIRWPDDNDIRWGNPVLLSIAKEHGKGWDVDSISRDFKELVGAELSSLEGNHLLRRFEAFCRSYNPR